MAIHKRLHLLKAELKTMEKYFLQNMARDNKRSVKKQVEWILIRAIEKYQKEQEKK